MLASRLPDHWRVPYEDGVTDDCVPWCIHCLADAALLVTKCDPRGGRLHFCMACGGWWGHVEILAAVWSDGLDLAALLAEPRRP